MLIKRISTLTGAHHEMELPITFAQLCAWQEEGVLIQNAMPQLTEEEREFVMTGITPEEWDAHYGDE